MVATLNDKCTLKYEAEKVHLQPLPRYRVADYEELLVRVSRFSTIEVRCVLYTVPSRLIGQQLTIRLYHDRLVGYFGTQQVVELERIRGASSGTHRRARCINYRHIIEGLRRKPRAFLYCTWQSEILPNEHWRTLWQQLSQHFDADSAAKLIVEALYIAASQDKEVVVAHYLQAQLESATLTLTSLQQQFGIIPKSALALSTVQQHPLASYDQLLRSPACPDTIHCDSPQPEQSLSSPQSPPQATASLPHAQPLAEHRTESSATSVVLCSVFAGTVSIGERPPIPGADAAGTRRGSTAHRKKFYQL